MKQRKIIVTLLVLIIFVLTLILVSSSKSNEVFENKTIPQHTNNSLAVMVEQEDGSYEQKSGDPTNWITSGYVLNETLSNCENGGKILWDKNSKKVVIKSNISDKCYIYFSLPPPVVKVLVSNKPDSGYLPKATVTMTNGEATYNAKYNKILVSSITGEAKINLTYNEPATKDYLKGKVEGYAGKTQGTGKVIHETFVNSSSKTIDVGYRYEGKNPNNYIWFNNELWRIIGSVPVLQSDGTTTTNLVKIVRNDPIGALSLDKNNTNKWADSSGNAAASLNFLLNGAYLDWKTNKTSVSNYCYSGSLSQTCDYSEIGIKDEYRSMIKEVTWQTGGITSNDSTTSTIYEEERGTVVCSSCTGWGTSFVGKIGLAYLSDFGYSALASSCARNIKLSAYNNDACFGSSWLFNQGYEWFLSFNSGATNLAYFTYFVGDVLAAWTTLGFDVRPALYLDSTVYVVDGTGTINNPYIIAK